MLATLQRLEATAVLLGLLASPAVAHADDPVDSCSGDSAIAVGVTGALGAGVGGVTAFTSSGILATADDTRDYSFATGALVGLAVTSALTGLYVGVDVGTDCGLTEGSISWSVPITMAIVGTALPIAIWGASPDALPPAEPPPATTASFRVVF